MFRHFARSAFSRSRASRDGFFKASTAIFIVGISGTLYYTSRTIHGDSIPVETHPDQDSNPVYQNLSRDADARLLPLSALSGGPKYDRLREFEASGVIHGETGISKFYTISIPSLFRQDAHAITSVQLSTGTSWSFFGLFDGHNGERTSQILSENLIPTVLNALVAVISKYQPPSTQQTEIGMLPDSEATLESLPEAINKTIKETFIRVDNNIVHTAAEIAFSSPSKSAAVIPLEGAQSGSSALLAFYDSESRLLRVALTGNSRAVLGRSSSRREGQDFYEAHVLSADQDAHNCAEEARLNALHPDQKTNYRLPGRGIGMTRAFGDAAHKWSREVQERLHQEYLGDKPPVNITTPPYIIAEPEVTTMEVKPGDFLVMASNGLWSCLTNEEVVGLIGLWMKRWNVFDQSEIVRIEPSAAHSDTQIAHRDELPVAVQEDNTVMYPRWRTEKRFINVDENAAAHLARNALGGADEDLTAALLSMIPPRSRKYRDDISATVIFFDRN